MIVVVYKDGCRACRQVAELAVSVGDGRIGLAPARSARPAVRLPDGELLHGRAAFCRILAALGPRRSIRLLTGARRQRVRVVPPVRVLLRG